MKAYGAKKQIKERVSDRGPLKGKARPVFCVFCAFWPMARGRCDRQRAEEAEEEEKWMVGVL